MARKTIIVLLVGLTLVLGRFAEAQQSDIFASGGTLVVAVPSRDGLIIAADSRLDVVGTAVHCDDQFKIIEPIRAARIAASVVGNVVFFAPPGPDESDFCKNVKRARRLLDVPELASHYLETETVDVSTSRMEEFALQCVAAVQKLHAYSPLTLKPFAGRALFSVILMAYDPKTRTAIIREFFVQLSDEIKPEIGKITVRTFSFESKREMFLFGASNYFRNHVIGGIGRKFLSQETIGFIRQDTTIGKTDFRPALSSAMNVIDATSKTTALVPPPGGIGGTIDVLLLGNEPRPRRVKWKSR